MSTSTVVNLIKKANGQIVVEYNNCRYKVPGRILLLVRNAHGDLSLLFNNAPLYQGAITSFAVNGVQLTPETWDDLTDGFAQ